MANTELAIEAIRLLMTGISAAKQYNVDAQAASALLAKAEAEGRDVSDAEIEALVTENTQALADFQKEIDAQPGE